MDLQNSIQGSEPVKAFLPTDRGEKVHLRVKKRRLSIRIAAVVFVILGVLAVGVVAAAKVSDGTLYGIIKERIERVLARGDDGFLTENIPQGGDTVETEVDKSCENDTETTLSKSDETQQKDVQTTQNNVNFGTENSENSGKILPISARSEISSAVLENMTGRQFDIEFLASMKSSVLPICRDQPVCLVIHTHSTESYLSGGEEYFDTENGKLYSDDDSDNVVAVGAVFAKTLNDAGIPTLHITRHHDVDGLGRSYVNSRATVAKYLARYPTIKYVFDLDRSCEIENGSLIRDTVSVGGYDLARIRLSVGGRSDLAFSGVAANLSFAMRIRALLYGYEASLVHPVLISDAIFCDAYAPRSLKIEIGSCASTLEEAKESAVLLAEAISCLLLS